MTVDPIRMFADRIEIRADLVALSHLHVGNGNALPGCKPADGSDDETIPDVTTVSRDEAGAWTIPGSTIKGVVRAHADPALARLLLGEVGNGEDESTEDAVTGSIARLWFYAVPCEESPDPGHLQELRADGDRIADGFTRARTRLARDSGTAEEHLLYHAEMVPAQSRFGLRLLWFPATGADPTDADVEDVAKLLSPLAADEGIGCGRGTRQGDGKLRLDTASVTTVVKRLSPTTGLLETIDGGDVASRLRSAIAAVPHAATVDGWTLRFRCDGPFISVRQRQRGKSAPGEEVRAIEPLKLDDKPVLWPSSLLGALRARAAWLVELERLRGNDRFAPDRPAAIPADDRDLKQALPRKRAVSQTDDVRRRLSSVERLFGVAGWRGGVTVRSVTWAADAVTPQLMTSVTIDRFTGGAHDGALFKTVTVLGAVFDAHLALDRRHGLITDTDSALFELLLDDLRANGLFLGHGAAKGFGWFTVEDPPGTEPATKPAPAAERSGETPS